MSAPNNRRATCQRPKKALRRLTPIVLRDAYEPASEAPSEPAMGLLTDPALCAWLHDAGADLPTDYHFQ